MALRTFHGKYVGANPDGYVNANYDNAYIWEIRIHGFVNGDMITLKSSQEMYLRATPWGTVDAVNRPELGTWELFLMRKVNPGIFTFESYHGKYLAAEMDGALNANRAEADLWETFQVIFME